MSVYYYLRVVIALYGPHSGTVDNSRPTLPEYLVLIVASAAMILPGLWPNALISLLSHLLP